MQFLIPLIRKAELSRTEVQILTDLLLNKHLDEFTEHSEWIEVELLPLPFLQFFSNFELMIFFFWVY